MAPALSAPPRALWAKRSPVRCIVGTRASDQSCGICCWSERPFGEKPDQYAKTRQLTGYDRVARLLRPTWRARGNTNNQSKGRQRKIKSDRITINVQTIITRFSPIPFYRCRTQVSPGTNYSLSTSCGDDGNVLRVIAKLRTQVFHRHSLNQARTFVRSFAQGTKREAATGGSPGARRAATIQGGSSINARLGTVCIAINYTGPSLVLRDCCRIWFWSLPQNI
jgi:hypothetical protein